MIEPQYLRPRSRKFISFLASALLLTIAVNAAAGSETPSLLPLNFVHGIPFVAVSVGGIETELMFDSGGKLGITLANDLIQRSGSVEVLEHKSKRGDSAGRVYEVSDILARKVSVAGVPLAEPIAGSVHYDWGLNISSDNGGAPVDLTRKQANGAIGLEAFEGRALLFDYAQRRLGIYPTGFLPDLAAVGWQAIDLKYDNEGPQITLKWEGRPLRLVLDTGANVSILKPSALKSKHTCSKSKSELAYCGEKEFRNLKTLNGKGLRTQKFILVEMRGVTFDGILGGDFFAHHLVVFDLVHRKLWIKKN